MIPRRQTGAPTEVVVDRNEVIYCSPMVRSDMVRVGEPLGADSRADTYGYAWIPRQLWDAVEDFQRPMPPFPPNFPVRQLVEEMGDTAKYDEVPYAAEIDRKLRLNPEHGVLWVCDGFSPDGSERVKLIATLCEGRLVRWNWFEAVVGLPIVNGIAKMVRAVRRLIRYRKS